MSDQKPFLPAEFGWIEFVAAHIGSGGVAVIPTETFYGLAADPRNPRAVERIFRYKNRDVGRALPLIAADQEQVDALAPGWREIPAALELAERFWPGPLSLILPAGPGLAPGVAALDRTIAVRVTPHGRAAALARLCHTALIATSANLSGLPAHTLADDAWRALGSPRDVLVLNDGPTPGGAPSTLVDPRVDPPRVVRRGAIEI